MLKRCFDIFFSVVALLFLVAVIALLWIFCAIDTGTNGLFVQDRVGQFGKIFRIYKLKTIRDSDSHISALGAFLRKYKIDEFPQLWNVLMGEMSFVGPRPDVPGYYDLLEGEERNILKLKPGITSSASLKYVDEEYLLQQQSDPKKYNDEVVFRDKVKMNLDYYYHNSIFGDIKIIIKTVFGVFFH
jgi:lipopolysaccharide/colanic/teichoic acid biosynthesis glycosyltransferase